MRHLWPLGLIFITFGGDRLSKRWAAAFLAQHGPTELHPLVTLREAYNSGIAFGMYQGIGPVIGWLTIVVVVALGLILWRLPVGDYLMRAGLAVLVGGAIGNMWDRIRFGEVLDFIVSPIRPGIFNLADVFIYAGIAICFLATIWPPPKPSQSTQP